MLIVTLPLPQWAIDLASIFRSTGRFVWPLLYLTTIGIVVLLGRRLSAVAAVPILVAAFAAQAQDQDDVRPSAEIQMSNDTLQMRYMADGERVRVGSNSQASATFFLSEERDIVLSGDLLFPADIGFTPLDITFGPRAYAALLEDENISEMDLFVAVTNDDENNIMSCLLAKRMGARRVVALINRRSYVDLLQAGQIDVAISPAQATIGKLLAHVRRGDVVAVHSLRRGAAEALEAVVHGDRESCRVTDRRVEEIQLPAGATIGAVVRGDKVIMAHHDTVIRAEDHVIIFVTDKKSVSRVETT